MTIRIKKNLSNPIKKLFNEKFYKNNSIFKFSDFNKTNALHDMSVLNTNDNESFFENSIKSFKNFSSSSNNNSVSIGNRNIRNFLNTSVTTSQLNYSPYLNTLNNNLTITNNSFGLNNSLVFDLTQSN